MTNNTFDPHARILHNGQYKLKDSNKIAVPIRSFRSEFEEELSVQERINNMNLEIQQLEHQIEQKKQQGHEQANKILEQVKDEARKVMEDAEQHAFDRIQKSVHEKENIIQQSKEDAEKIMQQAQKEASEILEEAQKTITKLKTEAHQEAFTEGKELGFQSGKEEIQLLVERLHSVVAETVRERERILMHSETQVINLVLTMVGKIVKKLTADYKEIVINNIKAALELLKGAMTIFIHVSPRDYNFAVSHKQELINMIEAQAEIKFIEDPTIEPGGVYIETDTGDIDATINSQLEELETQMRFYMPVKIKTPETKKREVVSSNNDTLDNESVIDDSPTAFAQQENYGKDLPPEMRYNESSSEEIIVPEVIPVSSDSESEYIHNSYSENSDNLKDKPVDDIIV
ncbi:Flagellar assembly protein FliH [Brevinema andersonii]|uniref:Flagellar assembly protein FliH n=1 Tax=Brevinema andersonii TaxID=34097 RepID=A0A1I1EIV3_BREAD|nr:flagellar assembly protein FliH [Brevinema andersonii]SFB84930.1 Flagellar assembly protein FliH [Brevinema andersonii]